MSRAARRRPDPFRVAQVDLDRAKRWPIGHPVTVTKDDGSQVETQTRSAPYQVSTGTWVIFVEGITGCSALARVTER